MKKYLIALIIVSIVLVGSSAFLGYRMLNYKNSLTNTTQQLEQQKAETQDYKDTLVASTTYCKSDNGCATLVLDRDGCIAIPMSTYNMNYFEVTHTDWGGCDALVVEQPVAVCKESRCVFTKN